MSSPALQDTFGLAGRLLDGQYRADAVVGEGGFGVVYRGRHLALDQPIAIKILKGLDGGDPKVNALVLEKFREEARLLYTLSQSSLHIVRSLSYGAAETPVGVWAPYMILEWLEGRALADDIRDRRKRGLRGRSLAETFQILEPVAAGLGVAHAQRVAHRDIKPANVFLLNDPNGPRVKLLDFGIAKMLQEGPQLATKGTLASFTPLYAAPEQVDPRYGKTGLATDVFAFALLVTELMTDRTPIDDGDIVSIMRTTTDPHRRPTPRTRGAQIPDAIEQVLGKALAVDPRERWPSIAEFWAALQQARASSSHVGHVSHVSPGPFPSMPMPDPRTSPPRMAQGHATTAPPMSPPIGTPPPRQQVIPGPPVGMPPPRTWMNPQRRLQEAQNPWFVLFIILVSLAVLFVGSCVACTTCAAIAQPQPR